MPPFCDWEPWIGKGLWLKLCRNQKLVWNMFFDVDVPVFSVLDHFGWKI